MWELRLILILIGAVFIAAVYLLSRQRKTRSANFHRNAPSLGESDSSDPSLDSIPGIPATPAHIAEAAAQAKPVEAALPVDQKQLILVLHVTCREPDGFAGAAVLAALQSAGLHYGQYQVFHRLSKDAHGQSVFSVANMVEPGVLDMESLPQTRIPGLTLFLVLPGPQDGVAACADMLATARSLARQLEGEVLDDGRNMLTVQAAQHIRERIISFQRQVRLPPAD